ncbi:MAG: peptidoglycan-associated lipoprotein [Gammaproteobacteria bacterium]|nr:MAG: peptidoglycan-associated lipoprotein [Gammaproteobacteria bacterium]
MINRVLLAGAVFALVACSSTKQSGADVLIDDLESSEFSTENDDDGVLTGGLGDGNGVSGSGIDGGDSFALEELNNPDSPLSERIIYFPVDSNVIGDEYTGMVEAHARFLAENPDINIILEGHTDERGSREYNLALGERRAQSVSDFLLLQGASSSQTETVSYGEERPAQSGQSEAFWGQNRRVEILYINN